MDFNQNISLSSSNPGDLLKEIILNLRISSLPQDWVDNVWGNHFLLETQLPNEYTDQIDVEDALDNLLQFPMTLKKWLKESKQSREPLNRCSYSWKLFYDLDVTCEVFLSWLSAFLEPDFGITKSIIASISAARVYVLVLNIPGSLQVIVKEGLLTKCLKLLTLGYMLKTTDNAKSKQKQNQRTRNSKKSINGSNCDQLSQIDKMKILDELCMFLSELSDCLDVIHLKESYLPLEGIIRPLVEFICLEVDCNVFASPPPPRNTFHHAVLLAYDAMIKFFRPEHGVIKEAVSLIFEKSSEIIFTNELEDFSTPQKICHSKRNRIILAFLKKVYDETPCESGDFIIGIIQNMMSNPPERKEPRVKLLKDIFTIISSWPSSMVGEFILWTVCLLFCENFSSRVSAIELISKCLSLTDSTEGQRLHEIQLSAILSACHDSSPTVRSKALAIFSLCFLSNKNQLQNVLNKIFHGPATDKGPLKSENFFPFNTFFYENNKNTICQDIFPEKILPTAFQIVKLLEAFISDKSVLVKKYAFQALSNLYLSYNMWLNGVRLQSLLAGCKDPSLSIRKMMIGCLSDLLIKRPSDDVLINAWVEGLLPLVNDPESTCQTKAVEMIQKILISRIKSYDDTLSQEDQLPWKIMRAILCKGNVTSLRTAFRIWTEGKLLREPLFTNIITHINTDHSLDAWSLIVCISEYVEFPDPEFIFDYYFTEIHKNNGIKEPLDHSVLDAVFLNWKNFREENQEKLFHELKSALKKYTIPFHLIPRSLDILHSMKTDNVRAWSQHLIQSSSDRIISIMRSDTSPLGNHSQRLDRHIVTLGEAAFLHPGVRPEVIHCLAKIIENDLPSRTQKSGVDLRALAVVTLVKLSLQDSLLAKEYVPLLINIVHDPKSSYRVKINILGGLADLCVRFTYVVEDFLSDICIALKDSNKNIRKAALNYICELILEEYLKLKSPMVFYLFTILLDPAPDVVELFKTFVKCHVKKYPATMAYFFIQAIFFYNNFEGEEYAVDKSNFSQLEKKLFALDGPQNFKKREKIYKFMLQSMPDIGRFTVQNRLCLDVLDAVCVDKIPLNGRGRAVLGDALSAMALQEMRIETLQQDSDSSTEEADSPEDYAYGIARKVIVSTLLKRNYIESLVPVVGRLKRKLYEIKSPLASQLMLCVKEIMKEFKKEVKEIFAGDPELAGEVEFDLQDVPDDGRPSIQQELLNADPSVQQTVSIIFLSHMAQSSGTGGVEEVMGEMSGTVADVGPRESTEPPTNSTPRQSARVETFDTPVAGPSGLCRRLSLQGLHFSTSASRLGYQTAGGYYDSDSTD